MSSNKRGAAVPALRSTARPSARAILRAGALLAGMGLLAGCAKPAGDLPEPEAHGYANAMNIAAMRGYEDPQLVYRLAEAFRANVDPAVTFDFDSDRLEPSALAVLRAQADWINANPGALMAIYGHADLVGSAGYNQRIGLRRAAAVAEQLTRLGVAPNRLLLVESRGETEPVVPTEGRERRNRRAVTQVDGYEVAWDPRRFDGKRAQLVYENYSTNATEEVNAQATDG